MKPFYRSHLQLPPSLVPLRLLQTNGSAHRNGLVPLSWNIFILLNQTKFRFDSLSKKVQSWKTKLPLQTIMRMLQVLVPQVEKICIDK